MRSIKELLELMLQNQNYFSRGLCNWVGTIYRIRKDLISYDEYNVLLRYIDKNRPHRYSSLSAYRHRNTDYYWKVDDIHPRIKWIKKHIKKNK